jgi:hypothetical protein
MVRRRKLRFNTLDDVAVDARSLLRRGYDRAGTWSLAQVCDHLTTFMRMSLDGFPPITVPWFVRSGRATAKWMILRFRWIPSGFKAPAELLPADAGEDAAATEALARTLTQVRDHAGAWRPSPLLGPLTPEEWRMVHTVHAQHHLSFLVPK